MRERLRLREGWSALILLFLLLLTMAGSFTEAGLADELRILPAVVVLGVLAGFIFARARLPGLLAHPLGLVVGLLCCFLLVSTLVLLPFGLRVTGPAPGSWLKILTLKGNLIAERLQAWVLAAQEGETSSSDALPFTVQTAALGWLMAFYAAWFVFRSHWVWGAIVPAGLTTFIGVYYGPPRLLIYFIVYLLWSLLLVVRSNVYHRETEWQRYHVIYDQQVGLEFLRDGALLSLIVVALIWLIPRPPTTTRFGDFWYNLQGPWNRVQAEWNRLYSSLSYRDQPGMTTFGRTLTLGGAVSLSNEAVMEVQAPESRYWRAVVLDRYTGTGWVDTTPTTLLSFGPGVPLSNPGAYRARELMVQTLSFARSGTTLLFAAAEPLQVEVPIRAQALPRPLGSGYEVSALYATASGPGGRFVIRSLVTHVDVHSLRNAGRNYPEWVSERYLQLPATLPPRIGQLARDIAATEPTPYDQAVAIETYLRQIRYNQAIASPPPGSDPVDWFLFDYHEGYCTYFASAMVLMCRSLGIPARLAQGYAPGEYVPERQAFTVRERDAHAWPEVFFPGYGWIEFEPTPSRPTFTRPLGSEDSESSNPPGQSPEEREWEKRLGPDVALPPGERGGDISLPAQALLAIRRLWFAVAAAGMLFLGAAILAWDYIRHWRAMQPAERLYLRLLWVSGALGVSAHAYQTPFEFGRSVDEVLGSGQTLAGQIVRLYVRQRYGRHAAGEGEVAAAAAAWQRLKPLIVRRVVQRPLLALQARRQRRSAAPLSWTEMRPR